MGGKPASETPSKGPEKSEGFGEALFEGTDVAEAGGEEFSD